jgi:hypothetical protein
MDTSGDRHPGVAKKRGVLVFGETLFTENPCVSILLVTSELRETSLLRIQTGAVNGQGEHRAGQGSRCGVVQTGPERGG